jgi:hypothetical protein
MVRKRTTITFFTFIFLSKLSKNGCVGDFKMSDDLQPNLEKRIVEINALNQQGIAEVMRGEVDASVETHKRAAGLAKGIEGLNPDYYALSLANLLYSRRKKKDAFSELLEIISEGLQATKDNPYGTTFGRARVMEEWALVLRYYADDSPAPINSLLNAALILENEAIPLYEKALKTDGEIVSRDEIRTKRLWRTIGVVSTLYADAAEIAKSSERLEAFAELTGKAVAFANDELYARLDAGEREGDALVNAYLTVGVAQSKLVRVGEEADELAYFSAKENLEKALTTKGYETSRQWIDVVINLELAQLEYEHDPKNITAISGRFDLVLDNLQTSINQANPAGLEGIRDRLFDLAHYLGSEYSQRLRAIASTCPSRMGTQLTPHMFEVVSSVVRTS